VERSLCRWSYLEMFFDRSGVERSAVLSREGTHIEWLK
jgi:hypothetical protein